MTVSFSADILPLFRQRDLICMEQMGVLLSNYEYMANEAGDDGFSNHANANHVYARLAGTETPQMPRGGPYWSQGNLQLFMQWMQDGYQP